MFGFSHSRPNLTLLGLDILPRADAQPGPPANGGPAAPLRSLAGSASRSAKRTNEDAHGIYCGEAITVTAVADGVGSAADSHLASSAAVREFLAEARRWDRAGCTIDLTAVRAFWSAAATGVQQQFGASEDRYRDQRSPLQTTLLTVIETAQRYFVSYLGNGSIHLIRGDYHTFLPRRYPWCMSDLALGHSRLADNGQEVLFRVLAPNVVPVPRILTVEKDFSQGEVLVLTTDGVSSPDHVVIGRDPDGQQWQAVNPHLARLLSHSLSELAGGATGEQLRATLEGFLAESVFDDDATVAVLFSGTALRLRESEASICK